MKQNQWSILVLFLMLILLPTMVLADEDTTPQGQINNGEYPTFDSFFTLYQPYIGNISAYEPIYFLVGTNPAKSSFQFSFRYRFLNPEGPLAVKHPWVKGLHFGYTQTSFWDLKSDSAPFEDTSYKPELFLLTDNLSPSFTNWQGVFLQTGILHESNGGDGDGSRNTNIFYVKPIMIFFSRRSGLGLEVGAKVWTYFNNSSISNSDLPDYRGYFELETKLGMADSLVASGLLRWAKKGGSVQLDLTYPLQKYLSDNLAIYLQAQYVNTLAESLLHYQERTEAFRLGICFLR